MKFVGEFWLVRDHLVLAAWLDRVDPIHVFSPAGDKFPSTASGAAPTTATCPFTCHRELACHRQPLGSRPQARTAPRMALQNAPPLICPPLHRYPRSRDHRTHQRIRWDGKPSQNLLPLSFVAFAAIIFFARWGSSSLFVSRIPKAPIVFMQGKN
ncbi:unnamed protein product [Victoria cruziana]